MMNIILLLLCLLCVVSVSASALLVGKWKKQQAQPLAEAKQKLNEARKKLAAANAAEKTLTHRIQACTLAQTDAECAFLASSEHAPEVKKEYAEQLTKANATLCVSLNVPEESLAMLLDARCRRYDAESEKDISRKLQLEGVLPLLKSVNTTATVLL
jgi:Na+-transporting methylmalonyl-CoA/oxaloacetate decarboxylase gamma subunit